MENIKNLISKKFKKAALIGVLVTSLSASTITGITSNDNTKTAEAKSNKKNKYKIKMKRIKGTKKVKEIEEGKVDKEKYKIKLKKGNKKIKPKYYSVILNRKIKVKDIDVKDGVTNYSDTVNSDLKIIKKGNKAKGFKVRYDVDDNVKATIKEIIVAKVTSLVDGKKKVTKKRIKNRRIILGKDYNNPNVNNNPNEVKYVEPVLTQDEIDKKFEEETGEKLYVTATPAPKPTFDPNTSIVEEPTDPNEGVKFYDDDGKEITDPNYTPEPLPTVKPTIKPGSEVTPAPTVAPIVHNTENGSVTINHNEDAYNQAKERLFNQSYNSGINLDYIDPTINTLYFNYNSNYIKDNSYIDALRYKATDKNNNDITNNIVIYDNKLQNVKGNNEDSNVIVEVRDSYNNYYSELLNISTRDINDPLDMTTGSVVIDENDNFQTFYEVFLLNTDPVLFAKTDNMRIVKDNIDKVVKTKTL